MQSSVLSSWPFLRKCLFLFVLVPDFKPDTVTVNPELVHDTGKLLDSLNMALLNLDLAALGRENILAYHDLSIHLLTSSLAFQVWLFSRIVQVEMKDCLVKCKIFLLIIPWTYHQPII